MIIALADEGVPIQSLARGTKTTSDEVRETLRFAIADGKITKMPREAWAPGLARDARIPDAALAEDDTRFVTGCIRCFKLTKNEARLLTVLLRRKEVTKETLLNQMYTGPDVPEIKIIDVFVCKLRKKLKMFDIEIKTIWAHGYCMTSEMRSRTMDTLDKFSHDPVEGTAVSAPGL
jgi:DNA-binding winged helix-turn-helix (wHTH) protein